MSDISYSVVKGGLKVGWVAEGKEKSYKLGYSLWDFLSEHSGSIQLRDLPEYAQWSLGINRWVERVGTDRLLTSLGHEILKGLPVAPPLEERTPRVDAKPLSVEASRVLDNWCKGTPRSWAVSFGKAKSELDFWCTGLTGGIALTDLFRRGLIEPGMSGVTVTSSSTVPIRSALPGVVWRRTARAILAGH